LAEVVAALERRELRQQGLGKRLREEIVDHQMAERKGGAELLAQGVAALLHLRVDQGLNGHGGGTGRRMQSLARGKGVRLCRRWDRRDFGPVPVRASARRYNPHVPSIDRRPAGPNTPCPSLPRSSRPTPPAATRSPVTRCR